MIFFECNADEKLVVYCGNISRKLREHCFGKGNIEKSMKRSQNVLAMVDQDPGREDRHKYFQSLETVEEEHSVTIKKDGERNNYLIVLQPNLEGWMLAALEESRIDLKKHKIPENVKKLHDLTDARPEIIDEIIKCLREEKSPMLSFLRKAFNDYYPTQEDSL